MSRLDDELEERYPMPQDDAIIELSRRELEALRRAAYRAGRLASAGPGEREALLAEA